MDENRPREITKENARRFLVLKQNFLPQKEGKEGTLDAIRLLGCVQTDPINVVHRNQHLVLHNRVKDYDTRHLEELLYKDRQVFEYWCNEKSIIPTEDFRYFLYRMRNPSRFHSPFYEHIKEKKVELKGPIARALLEIRKHGPLSAQELEGKGEITGKLATNVLNLLWDRGDLMIHHMEANRRYYDLTENILPSVGELEEPTSEEYEHFIVHKYMVAYGLVDARDWRFGWLPLKSLQKKAIIRRMVEGSELSPVKVEGVRQEFYVPRELLNSLDNSDSLVDEKVHFIAPLDNLLWNRRVIREIFDFDYSWEVYKVPEKRVHGYYVMPILRGTRFIGRLDPKLDRQNRTMIINSLSLVERSFDKNLFSELAQSLRRFSVFHGVSQISIERTQPSELKRVLLRELD